ncbi:hypothetical protein BDA99DRAFT_543341 [Phascolomyces articulosus]|uniref:Uncharacterized protein n=1 Tax=Phascolomyces articulosus TaxID=60185 RepID=A0AAD5P7U4_9FUNG|nr:hypothetical protein BDA99DRAFT_543341 [Phascolomyces articulosus]
MAYDIATKHQMVRAFDAEVFLKQKESQDIALGRSNVSSTSSSSSTLSMTQGAAAASSSSSSCEIDARYLDVDSTDPKTRKALIREKTGAKYNDALGRYRKGDKQVKNTPWTWVANALENRRGLVPTEASWARDQTDKMPVALLISLLKKLLRSETNYFSNFREKNKGFGNFGGGCIGCCFLNLIAHGILDSVSKDKNSLTKECLGPMFDSVYSKANELTKGELTECKAILIDIFIQAAFTQIHIGNE